MTGVLKAVTLVAAGAVLAAVPGKWAEAGSSTVRSYEPEFFRNHVLAVGVLEEVQNRGTPWRAHIRLQENLLGGQAESAVVEFAFPPEPAELWDPGLLEGARVVVCLRLEGGVPRHLGNPRMSLFPNRLTLCPVPMKADLERVRRTLRAFAGAFTETDARRRSAVLLSRSADFGDAWSATLLAGQLLLEGAHWGSRPAVYALARDALEDRTRPWEHRLSMDEVLRELGTTLHWTAPSRLEALRDLWRTAPDANARARAAAVLRRSVELLEHAIRTTESEEARRPYSAALEAYRKAAVEAGTKR